MNKNRCSLDIAREVLFIASVRARKTRIMYGANLSFRQVQKYLNTLLNNGLLEHVDSGYLVTEAGREFLSLYEKYLEQSKDLRHEVERNTKNKLQLENMCFNNKCQNKHSEIEKDPSE